MHLEAEHFYVLKNIATEMVGQKCETRYSFSALVVDVHMKDGQVHEHCDSSCSRRLAFIKKNGVGATSPCAVEQNNSFLGEAHGSTVLG